MQPVIRIGRQLGRDPRDRGGDFDQPVPGVVYARQGGRLAAGLRHGRHVAGQIIGRRGERRAGIRRDTTDLVGRAGGAVLVGGIAARLREGRPITVAVQRPVLREIGRAGHDLVGGRVEFPAGERGQLIELVVGVRLVEIKRVGRIVRRIVGVQGQVLLGSGPTLVTESSLPQTL